MLILGLDTCSMSSSVSVADESRVIAAFTINHKKTHSERIMPQIEEMLKAAEIGIENIDVFAASVGPGSFTGVRIGVATVKAFAQAKNKPCVSVSSLEALAYSVKPFKGLIAPILDARRNQVYNAVFESDGKNIKRITNDRALSLDELLKELKASEKDVMFIGDGVPVFRENLKKELGETAYFAPKSLIFNLASSVLEVAFSKIEREEMISYKELLPEYVRLSQAEQEKLKGKE